MASMRDMVPSFMADDLAQRRASKINLREALDKVTAYQTERRGVADKSRMIKEQAFYNQYPKVAGAGLGLPPETMATEPLDTTGLNRGKVVVDEKGNVTTQYEAPEQIDAAFMIKQYNKYKTDVSAYNAFLPADKKITVPSFKNWVQTEFPDYAEEILRVTKESESGAVIKPEAMSNQNVRDFVSSKGWDVDAFFQTMEKYNMTAAQLIKTIEEQNAKQ